MKTINIPTWQDRCEKHPDHQQGMVSNQMLQDRMQEEIDDLRRVHDCARTLVTVRGRHNTAIAYKRLEECFGVQGNEMK